MTNKDETNFSLVSQSVKDINLRSLAGGVIRAYHHYKRRSHDS